MQKLHRQTPRSQLASRKAVSELLRSVLALDDDIIDALPSEVLREFGALLRTARRAVPPKGGRIFGRGFNMIDVEEYNFVVDRILKLPAKDRRTDVLAVFVKLVGYVEQGTAEILLSRQQFADQCGIQPRHVSTAMTVLCRLKAVRREQDGRSVTYYVNANLIWNGDPERHKVEAAKSKRPSLQVIEGGAGHD
jgi:hypothetical protein